MKPTKESKTLTPSNTDVPIESSGMSGAGSAAGGDVERGTSQIPIENVAGTSTDELNNPNELTGVPHSSKPPEDETRLAKVIPIRKSIRDKNEGAA